MHHVYHRHGVVKGSIILVPSLVNNFNEYMISEKHGARDSLALGLASAHYDVYGYSPRTAHLPPHACTDGGFDCSVMKDWNVGTYVQDVEFIRTQVATHGRSLSSAVCRWLPIGVAAVNANPSGYSGLLLWEGSVYSTNPAVIALSAQNCSNLRAAISAGNYYEENLPLALKDLAQSGESATISFFGVPQPTVSGTPNWIQLVADPSATALRVCVVSESFRLHHGLQQCGITCRYQWHLVFVAGDRTYTSNLLNFQAPILAIEAGQGFGPYMQDTINLTSSRRVRIEADQAFGHLDGLSHIRLCECTQASHSGLAQIGRVSTLILRRHTAGQTWH